LGIGLIGRLITLPLRLDRAMVGAFMIVIMVFERRQLRVIGQHVCVWPGRTGPRHDLFL